MRLIDKVEAAKKVREIEIVGFLWLQGGSDMKMINVAKEYLDNLKSWLLLTVNEAIESRMVARRIQQAQKQIARRATRDVPAPSAEEWLEHHCRGKEAL